MVVFGSSYTSTDILFTPNPTFSAFVIGTQTLRPGSQITASGTTYSLATNGGTLVIDGTSTEAIGTIISSGSPGGIPSSTSLGGAGGTGEGPASTSTSKKSSSTRERGVWISASVVLVGLLMVLEL